MQAPPAPPPIPGAGIPGLGPAAAAAAPHGGLGALAGGIGRGQANLRGRGGAVAPGPANRPIRHVKLRAPDKLRDNETQQVLDQWKACFILYYSRDDAFQLFLDPETRWNHAAPNYGFAQEVDGLERTPAELRRDLLAFFQLVASYMPAYHISRSLKLTSQIRDVWRLIYRLQCAEITCDSFMNLASFKKGQTENYRYRVQANHHRPRGSACVEQ